MKTDFILNRLKEGYTWPGIIGVVTAFGVAISPEMKEAIIGAGVSLASLVAIFTKEKGSPDSKK